jgi:cytochrome b561
MAGKGLTGHAALQHAVETIMEATLNRARLQQQTRLRYDPNTILLHWLTAALVISLWVSEQIVDVFPKSVQGGILSLHITLGITLALMLVVRVIWRATKGRSLPGANSGLTEFAARAMHILLYIGVGVAVVFGIALEWIRGDWVWGLVHVPSITPGNIDLRHTVKGYHALAANFILIVAGLHATAALFHHYVLRDGVLRRMLPRKSESRVESAGAAIGS